MKVFIEECSNYDDLEPVIKRAIQSLGGIRNLFKKGETILVKPNLLQGAEPERAVTTHPDFIIAVVKQLEEIGVNVIVGDSPGGPMSERRLKRFYRKSRWDRVEEETNAKLNYKTDDIMIRTPEGRVIKSIDALKLLNEVDGVINLPKLKTHNLTVFTGAVKNTFGLVHGFTKSAYHGNFKSQKKFANLLLDVHDMVNPRISIMDGILGMEGSGPASGKPVKTSIVIASKNAIACDIATCLSVGIPLERVLTIKLSDIDKKHIKYSDLTPNDINKNIIYPKGGSKPWWAPDVLANILANFYRDRLILNEKKCIKCADCLDICPSDAIILKDYGPKISWFKCIRCYCCTEICPVEALNRK